MIESDSPSHEDEEMERTAARKTQVLHAHALEDRFRNHVPKPTDPDYTDYCTWQALKLVEAQRMKRFDSIK